MGEYLVGLLGGEEEGEGGAGGELHGTLLSADWFPAPIPAHTLSVCSGMLVNSHIRSRIMTPPSDRCLDSITATHSPTAAPGGPRGTLQRRPSASFMRDYMNTARKLRTADVKIDE